jgi:hypothetical protein
MSLEAVDEALHLPKRSCFQQQLKPYAPAPLTSCNGALPSTFLH